MPVSGTFRFNVDINEVERRLDVVLCSRLSGLSRSLATDLIRKGHVTVCGGFKKPGYRLKAGDDVKGIIPPPDPVAFKPEPMELHVLYEDPYLIVINKPPGVVVHPAPGHHTGTLLNGLLYHCPSIAGVGIPLRPGIVHRLDKDTSGALVVAKQASVHRHLADQFKSRRVKKTYLALVKGEITERAGHINLPIGRHPFHRKMMSTVTQKGRMAETVWRVRERFKEVTLLQLEMKTGRTHQIRVHCWAIHHPVIGDTVYCRDRTIKKRLSVSRQMLHAWQLGFVHPVTEQWLNFKSPIPKDMERVIQCLRKEKV
ncbi:MAG: RluA family pseudouridine synthase [Deltaproteobacteria bacterium]|nr:RluA family pseudouridine synthase [Deltaproteobacteria bacterium]